MIHVEDRRAVLEQAARVLSGEAAPPQEHRIIHKDGSIRWIRNTAVVHRDAHGRVTSYDDLISDVTARKQAEERCGTRKPFTSPSWKPFRCKCLQGSGRPD